MKRVLAAVLGASLLLAGCGQSSPPAATSSDPYADGVDHSWTASTAEGQRIYSALSQGLKSQDFNVGLSITATNGWGPIELNTSNGEYLAGDGHPITLNGKVYSTGLGVHADSEIHIHATNLETPVCTRFQADVGVDDEIGDKGSVVFQVFADGAKVFDSGVMTGVSTTQHIDVGIGNKSDLRLVVTNGGDGYSFDHADWAGANISCSAPISTGPSGSTDTSFGTTGKASLIGLGTPLAVQSDSSIILISRTETSTTLHRLTAAGTPDLTYGAAGSVVLPASQAAAVYPDGRIVLAYQEFTPLPDYAYTPGDLHIYRYSPSGLPDSTFGNGGTVTIPYESRFLRPMKTLVDSNGAILVEQRDGLLRINTDGKFDTSFGTNGILYVDTANNTQSAYLVDFNTLPKGRYAILSNHMPINGNLDGEYSAYAELKIIENNGNLFAKNTWNGPRFTQGNDLTSWNDGGAAYSSSAFGYLGPIRRIDSAGSVTQYQLTSQEFSNKITAYGENKLIQYVSGTPTGAGGNPTPTVNIYAYNGSGTTERAFGTSGVLTTQVVERILSQPNGGLLLVRENEIERIFQ